MVATKDVASEARLLDLVVRVDLAPDDTSHRRLIAASEALLDGKFLEESRFGDIVFGTEEPEMVGPSEAARIESEFKPYDPGLNESQLAVRGLRACCFYSLDVSFFRRFLRSCVVELLRVGDSVCVVFAGSGVHSRPARHGQNDNRR